MNRAFYREQYETFKKWCKKTGKKPIKFKDFKEAYIQTTNKKT